MAWMRTPASLAAGLVASALATGIVRAEPLPADIASVIDRLIAPPRSVVLPPLPPDGIVALVAAVNAHSASLGVTVDHGPTIRASRIRAIDAGRIAQLMRVVTACAPGATSAEKQQCAIAANDAAIGVLRTAGPGFGDIDAWPSLYVDGNGRSDTYRHDYAVLIDYGGDDRYFNNAGGNLLDHRRGRSGSAAPLHEPAIGCEQVQGNFPAPTTSAHDCIALPQAVLLDKGTGRDVYGELRYPRRRDHNPPLSGPRKVDGDCTQDPLVRRIATQGSGFQGNGLLIDAGGSDRYLGKTSAQGAGHVGGIGVLRDFGTGSDYYLAIRNSQGFALVGILGLLQDTGGTDWYGSYMPSPKNPSAEFQEDGSGGVIDDTGLCDDLPRMMQGTALLGGVGYLRDHNGSDVYVGAPDGTQPFSPQVHFYHSSQGFGCSSGIGMLEDFGSDRDRYREGPASRRNGVQITESQLNCLPAVPGVSVFSDDGA
jgi:hypothetical protein